MPYKSTDAAVQSSPYYGAYVNDELIELRNKIKSEQADFLTNENFSTTISRNSDGFIVSFENPFQFGKTQGSAFNLLSVDLVETIFSSKFSKKINKDFNFIGVE